MPTLFTSIAWEPAVIRVKLPVSFILHRNRTPSPLLRLVVVLRSRQVPLWTLLVTFRTTLGTYPLHLCKGFLLGCEKRKNFPTTLLTYEIVPVTTLLPFRTFPVRLAIRLVF